MKRLIFAIIIVLIAIVGLIYGFWYLNKSNEQADLLQKELENVMQVDLTVEDVNTEIKTTGNYAVVEETIKNYLNDVRKIYVKVSDYYTSDAISEILSADNIKQDEKNLSKVKEELEKYEKTLDEEMNNFEEMLDEENIMKAINEKGLRDYYNNIYENIMLSEAMQSNFQYVKEKIIPAQEKASEKLEGIEDVIKFLEENKNYWEINNDKIQFTNVRKLTEYYELLNEAV